MIKVKQFFKEYNDIISAVVSLVLTFACIICDIITIRVYKNSGFTTTSVSLPLRLILVGVLTTIILVVSGFLASHSNVGRCSISGEVAKRTYIVIAMLHVLLYMGYWSKLCCNNLFELCMSAV